MAVLGLTLGITSIVAVHLVSEQVARRLDALIPEPLAAYNFVAHRDDLKAPDYFELQRSWRLQKFPRQAIVGMAPFIDESVDLDGVRIRVIGLDFTRMPLDQMLGERLGEGSGERSGERISGSSSDGTLVWRGVIAGQDVPDLGRPILQKISAVGLLIADIGVAQELLGWQHEDKLSYIGVQVQSPFHRLAEWLDRLIPGASAGLPAVEPPILPGFRVRPIDSQHPASHFGDSVLFNISALGLLALVVAWFLIYQVAVFWVRRLAPVFARLDVLGVDRATLLLRFVLLLVTVGLVAAVCGILLGTFLAQELLAASVGGESKVELDAWIIGKAMGSAGLVCGIGGAWAFSGGMIEARFSRVAWLQVPFLAVLSLLIWLGLFIPTTDLFGAFMSIALLSIVLVFVIPAILRFMKDVSRLSVGNLLLRMGLREVVWFPRDLSVALSGLSLAIATAIGVGLMVDSFRGEFSDMLDQRLSYDFVVLGPAADLERLYAQANLLSAIKRVRIYHQQEVRVDDKPVQWVVTEVDAVEALRYGHDSALATDQVLMSEQLMLSAMEPGNDQAVQVGGHLELNGRTLQIVGVFKSFGDLVPKILTSQGGDGLHASTLRLSGSRTEIEKLAQQFPNTEWQDQQELAANALQTFDQTFVITSVLIAIAVGVGGIGVYIAVTVLRLNQRASAKLLTFMGISRHERFVLDVVRGLGVGATACLLALPLGLAFGWILCEVVNPRAFGWRIDLALSLGAVLVPMFWGMLAALLASLVRLGQNEGDFDAA